MLRLPDAGDLLAGYLRDGSCRRALDLGCGRTSYLTRFRPGIRTVGIDASAESIELARAAGVHDEYHVADLLGMRPEDLLAATGGEPFDIVALFDLIEHLPKREGWRLLETCEALTRRLVVVQTPNGFLEQGPEFGNPYQRHLSGWFRQDFEGLGYRVHGTSGLKWFHGYAGRYRPDLPGMRLLDTALGHLLRVRNHPSLGFNLLAVKDVRGVPARLGPA